MAKERRLKPPSEKELAQLPRWAEVAFAARCARRAQRFFRAGWPEAPAEHVEAVERAIRVAETRAAGTTRAGAVAVALCAGGATRAGAATTVSAHAAFSASARASAAASASAAEAARAVPGTAAESSVIRAMRADFDKLQAVAQKEGWTDKTPVPPEFFGPLWPEGEPPGWPAGQE